MRTLWRISVALIALTAWLLLWLAYPGHLHAAEGDQMFLYTGMFASDMILCPGGLANYIGAFIVQFFYCPCLGAALVALLLALLALGVAKFCKNDSSLSLTVLPSVFFFALLMDSKWTAAGLVGIVGAVWMAVLVKYIRCKWWKMAAILVLFPFAWQFFLKAKFYTYAVAPIGQWVWIVAGTFAVCILCSLLPNFSNKSAKLAIAGQICLYAVFISNGASMAAKRFEKLDEEIFRYEYMVRQGDWKGIISYASNRTLNSPLSTNALNLALAKNGQLGEKMFRYFQSGPRSLINFEERKISSEILFNLGFVNEASHLAFEDMASNPSRKRGVYHVTRLARYSAVDSSNAKLTARYLATLNKTLFYRNFEPKSDIEPVMEPKSDFFFDYTSFQNMLVLLASQRPDNRIVSEYLAASLLLNKDLKGFGAVFFGELNPPSSHREALQVYAALNGEEPSDELKMYMADFEACRGTESRMRRWASSYWYYYNFR